MDRTVKDDAVEEQLLENQAANKLKPSEDHTFSEKVEKLVREMPLTEDTTCGFWMLKGPFFQRFANQASYVILYGLVGCIFSMTYAYFYGTITTIEKRFKIPSKNTGIISIGNNISQVLVSAVLGYYGGKGHRPRWIGFGVLTFVIFCGLTAAPHFLYGPGENALSLTAEFGEVIDANSTINVLAAERSKGLCKLNTDGDACELNEGNLAPQIVLFLAQFISGVGGALYYTLGFSYMDDNTVKSKTPALISISFFLHMLGPAIGYALASFCLRVYIAPQLSPFIDDKDPRWLGAWWMGWLILGGLLFLSGVFLSLFPKSLPSAAARRVIEAERSQKLNSSKAKDPSDQEGFVVSHSESKPDDEEKASFSDMLVTFKRLITNRTLMYNNISSVFYYFGYTPYWIFTAKYIEIQYRQSASTSSMVTGTVTLVFSAIGVLISGLLISKYKPSARYMAAWNVIVGLLTVGGILAYSFIGCPGNEQTVIVNIHDRALDSTPTCNSMCNCDYVRYSPVCGENSMTYISPCHAGCKKSHMDTDGKKIFYDCACIPTGNYSTDDGPIFKRLTSVDLKTDEFHWGPTRNDSSLNISTTSTLSESSLTSDLSYLDVTGGQAIPGACPVNCFSQFVTFLAVMCFLKFIGATGRLSNFLVSIRCVPEKDKTVAMGFGMMMVCLLTFIPAPIFFGWVLDRLCLVWGKTCTNKGNCWLYDPESLRYILNIIAAAFILVGTLFDCGVWYYVKDLKIFDDKAEDEKIYIPNPKDAGISNPETAK